MIFHDLQRSPHISFRHCTILPNADGVNLDHHDSPLFPDMDVRRIMVVRVNSHVETSDLREDSRHVGIVSPERFGTRQASRGEHFCLRVEKFAQASDLLAGEFFFALDHCGQCCRRDASGFGQSDPRDLVLVAEKLQHLAIGNGGERMLFFLVGLREFAQDVEVIGFAVVEVVEPAIHQFVDDGGGSIEFRYAGDRPERKASAECPIRFRRLTAFDARLASLGLASGSRHVEFLFSQAFFFQSIESYSV